VGPVAITSLLLLALAAFCALSVRKLAIIVRLRPEVRWDHPGARLKTVVMNGLMQSRMLRGEWKPGLMHAAIFVGFLSLLVRKLHLIGIGYEELLVLPGLAGRVFASLKDAVEIAVLAACGYAFYRRLVLRPRRLEPNREALLVLTLITVIMLTDLAFDAFRFALQSPVVPEIAAERNFAFAGAILASAVSGLTAPALQAGYQLL
jgi:hypothetical protein